LTDWMIALNTRTRFGNCAFFPWMIVIRLVIDFFIAGGMIFFTELNLIFERASELDAKFVRLLSSILSSFCLFN